MADSKWVAISCMFAFISVYLLFIAYSAAIPSIEQTFNTTAPKTETINSTTTALSSISSIPSVLAVIAIIVVIFVILSVVSSFGAMGRAM